jgi:hypothetical protein
MTAESRHKGSEKNRTAVDQFAAKLEPLNRAAGEWRDEIEGSRGSLSGAGSKRPGPSLVGRKGLQLAQAARGGGLQ